MPTYVTLFRYSSEGFKHLNEEGRQQQMSLIEAHGGHVKDAYGLMGEWDVLFITEFPDEKSAMSALVTTCQSGMGTTQTMTALPWAEFVQLGHPSSGRGGDAHHRPKGDPYAGPTHACPARL